MIAPAGRLTTSRRPHRVARAGLCAAFAAAVLGVMSCQPSSPGGSPRVIVPPAASAAGSHPGDAAPGETETVPIAPIDRADRLVALLSVNVDSDPDEEQVIAVQRRDTPSAPVRILVADHDAPPSRWARIAWESPTGATVARFFTLSVEDLVGDHGLAIIARGMNADGRFTLDAFRRSPPAAGGDLDFRQICGIVGDDIAIQEMPRPESYVSGQKNGLSFPIVSVARDTRSANPMDLIRTVWGWRYSDNRYVAASPQRLPGEQAGQEQLAQLYEDLRPEAFEAFLAGAWVEQQPPRGVPAQILEFRPADRRIAIGSGGTVEVLVWRDTLRTLSDRVLIVAENEVVARSTRTISVRVTGIASLAVTIRSSATTAAGELPYARATEGGGATPPHEPARAPRPSGEYRGPDGLVVDFGQRTLAWSQSGQPRTASWVTFPLGGRPILSVRFADTGEERSWVMRLTEERDGGRTIRVAALSPVNLSVQGWEEAPGPDLELRQVEEAGPK